MGVVSSLVFAKRNVDKIADGDVGRAPVPIFQGLGAVAGTAELASTAGLTSLNNGVNSLFSKADILLGKSGVTKTICEGAGNMVNPLLCVASGVRVLRDEDKKSALTEETMAMSAMFAGEAVYKTARDAIVKSISNAKPTAIANDLNSCKAVAKKINPTSIKGALKSLTCGKYGKWVKLAGIVIADLGLVATSIYCFGAGKKLGKKITGRENTKEQSSVIQNIVKQPTEPLINSLAVKA